MPVLLENCGQRLPVETEIDEVMFAQFVSLHYTVDKLPYPMVLGRPQPFIDRHLTQMRKHLFSTQRDLVTLTEADVNGGVSPIPSWNPEGFDPGAKAFDVVKVDDVAELIASRQVRRGDRDIKVNLTPSDVSHLLRGLPVRAEGKLVIVPQRPMHLSSNEGAKIELTRGDLPQFLASRSIRLEGRPVTIQLTSERIRTLLRGGESEIEDSEGRHATVRMISNRGEDYSKLATPVEASSPAPQENRLALYLPYRQSWKLLGYGKGPLVDSLMLAPGETTSFEIRSWDRRRGDIETTVSAEIEQSSESTSGGKDAHDVADEAARSSQFKLNVEGKAAYQFTGGSVSAGVGINLGNELSKRAQETRDQVRESTTRAAARLKATRTMRIASGSELGSEALRTRQIRNENAGHTLHVDLFELITSYKVTTELQRANARLVVLVPNPLKTPRAPTIDRNHLRVYESVLRRVLLEPALVTGFEAARTVYMFEQSKMALCRSFSCSEESKSPIDGVPGEEPEAIKALRKALKSAVEAVQAAAAEMLSTAEIASLHFYVSGYREDPADITLDEAVQHFRQWLFLRYANEQDGNFLMILQQLIQSNTDDDLAVERFTSQIAAIALDSMIGSGLATIDRQDRVEAYLEGILDSFGLTWSAAWDIKVFYGFTAVDDAGVVAACKLVLARLEALNDALKKHQNKDTPSSIGAALAELTRTNDELVRATYPLRDVMTAYEQSEALLSHMQIHQDHYLFAIWSAQHMTGARPDLVLPNLPPGLVDPVPIALVNGLLACPINVDFDPALRTWFDQVVTNNIGLDALTNPDAALNTSTIRVKNRGGVFETRLGECDGLETWVRETRNIERQRRAAEVARINSEAKLTEARASDPTAFSSEAPSLHLKVEMIQPDKE